MLNKVISYENYWFLLLFFVFFCNIDLELKNAAGYGLILNKKKQKSGFSFCRLIAFFYCFPRIFYIITKNKHFSMRINFRFIAEHIMNGE